MSFMEGTSSWKDNGIVNGHSGQAMHVDAVEPGCLDYEAIIQLTFSSEDEGFQFFNKYAKYRGFSIRKDIVKRNSETGVIIHRRFLCSRAGLRDQRHMNRVDRLRKERAFTRCECPVQFTIQLDPGTNRWFVYNFEDKHNHELATSNEVAPVGFFHEIDAVPKSDTTLANSEFHKLKVVNKMEDEVGGYEQVESTLKELHVETDILEGEAVTVLHHMKERNFQVAKSDSSSEQRDGMHHCSEELTRYHKLMTLGIQVFYEASKSEEQYLEVMRMLKNQLKCRNLLIDSENLCNNESKRQRDEAGTSSVKVPEPTHLMTKGEPKRRIRSCNGDRQYKCGHCHRHDHTKRSCPFLRRDATPGQDFTTECDQDRKGFRCQVETENFEKTEDA